MILVCVTGHLASKVYAWLRSEVRIEVLREFERCKRVGRNEEQW